MYVCIYLCMYVCIYVCMYVYMHVCIFMYTCMYVCVYVCMCVCVCVCVCVCIYVYMCFFNSVLAIPKFIPSPEVEVKLDNSGFYGRTEFLCQFDASTSEKDLLYEVIWYVNQGQLHGFASMEWSPEIHHKTRLTEDILARNGQTTVGFNVNSFIYLNLNTMSMR